MKCNSVFSVSDDEHGVVNVHTFHCQIDLEDGPHTLHRESGEINGKGYIIMWTDHPFSSVRFDIQERVPQEREEE